jgi:hypothetical protein
MAIISITITESPIQKVSGIPINVTIDTNIPSTVFYTLDGTTPTTASDIAVGAISIPTEWNSVILSLFATDGVNSSLVVTKTYGPSVVGNRTPRDKVIGLCIQPLPNDNNGYFGAPSSSPNVRYGNIGGNVVDDPSLPEIPDGYDGTATGTPADYTNKEYNRQNYDIKYSDKTATKSWPEVGTLPAHVTIAVPAPVKGFSDANSITFDPKALVIVQDGRNPPADSNTPVINRQFFNMADNERIRDGSMYDTTAYEGNGCTGTYLRPQYNSKDNTWTFPYRDSETNRWIFSIESADRPISPRAIRQLLLPVQTVAERKVFRWIPFKRAYH